jgi:hypothetical protein
MPDGDASDDASDDLQCSIKPYLLNIFASYGHRIGRNIMMEKLLVGRWRLSTNDSRAVEEFGDHSMEFTPFGDLVYTTFEAGSITGRMLLVYRVEGNTLVTDQPSLPREERTPFRIENDALVLGIGREQSILVREKPQTPSDPLAYMLAIGNFAVNHGLDSAHRGSPFTPFLVIDMEQGRSLTRFVTDTPEKAHTQAQMSVTDNHPRACAYAYDGYVTVEEGRFDAVLVEVSQYGLPNGLLLAQPYTFKNKHTGRAGRMIMQTNQSWL